MFFFSYENSLNTILRLEALRYNALLGRISTSLNLLRRALKGEIIMSFGIENTFECVANRQVPEKWKEVRPCLLWSQKGLSLTLSFAVILRQPPAAGGLSGGSGKEGVLLQRLVQRRVEDSE